MCEDGAREKFPRFEIVISPAPRGEDGDKDLAIAGDFNKAHATVRKSGSNFRELLIARNIHDEGPGPNLLDDIHARQLLQERLIGIVDPGVRFRWFVSVGCIRAVLDHPTVDGLKCKVGRQKKFAFPFAQGMPAPHWSLTPQLPDVASETEFIKWPDANEIGILTRNFVSVTVFFNRLMAA